MARQLPDWIEGYLEYTAQSEPPKIFHKWVAISTIASAMERKVKIEWEKTLFPNMFIILVAKSGLARKGTALDFGEAFMRQIGVNLAPSSTTREALIQSIKEIAGLGMGGATPEPSAALTILAPELTVFLRYENVEMMTDLIAWYDCKTPWSYRTVGRGVEEIRGLWINLLGASTPELIQRSIPADIVGGGLASRTLFVFADRDEHDVVFPWIYYHSDPAKELKRKLTSDLSAISTLHGTVTYDEKFMAHYDPWYRNMKRNPVFVNDPNLSSYPTRRPVHLLKLCTILSASKGDSLHLDEDVFHRAVALLEEVEEKMPRVFMGAGTSFASATINAIMETVARRKIVKRSELLSQYFADMPYGVKSLDDHIQTMVKMGFATIKLESLPTGPDIVVTFNIAHPLAARYS